jgi:hypothetical protein
MKRLLFLLFVVSPLSAQENGIEQSVKLATMPTGEHVIHWHGKSGRSYFVQVSDENEPLSKWTWAPIIESGNDEEISHEVGGTGDRGFFHLQHTDQVPGLGETLDTADFEADGLSNLDEIAPFAPFVATNPLDPDTDGDGMSDGFERTYGFDPNNSDEDADGIPDGSGDSDGDGLSNSEETTRATDPGNPDSDRDGMIDGADADPTEILVDWEKTGEAIYLLFDVNAALAEGEAKDLNDEGDVLFSNGIWADGEWISIETPEQEGSFLVHPDDEDEETFTSTFTGWGFSTIHGTFQAMLTLTSLHHSSPTDSPQPPPGLPINQSGTSARTYCRITARKT